MKVLGKLSAGSSNTVNHQNSQALGTATTTTKSSQCVVGTYNDTNDANSDFIVGSGNSTTRYTSFAAGKNTTSTPLAVKSRIIPAGKSYIIVGAAVILEDDLASIAGLAASLEGLL
jgi:hypothetical protein